MKESYNKEHMQRKTSKQVWTSKLTGHSARFLTAIAAILLVAVLGVHLLFMSHATTPSWQFASSGLEGSGFQNVLAYSPFKDGSGNRPLIMGADIAGTWRSIDSGKNWLPDRVGLPNTHVASVMWSDTTPGKVFVATDSKLAVSTDFGLTWRGLAAAVNFDANGSYQLNGAEHPRPTGKLLEQDNSGSTKYLYAATATQGVKRSSDGGATWEKVALAGDHLRSIALDPSNPDKLYVATVEAGLQVTTTARGAFTFSRVAGSPNIPEEMRFIAGNLYVATHDNGIQMYDGSWHALNNGIALTSAWESITGYRDGSGNIVLYAGCTNPVSGQDIMRSTNGGSSWTSISSGPNVTISSQEYGQTYNWWAASNGYLSVHGNAFVVADIAVNPDNNSQLILAGRGGAKAVIQSGSNYTWYPSVHGLMVTVNNNTVADPHIPGRVYVLSMDYTFLASNDHGRTIIGSAPAIAPKGITTGDYVALDGDGPANQPSPVYLAASKRGNPTTLAGIYSNPDPIGTPNNWTDEHSPVAADTLAMGVGHDSSGARIILASITGHGLYRKVGPNWSLVSGTTPFSNGGYGTFAWVPHSQLVYAMDSGGTWRSNSAGASGSWTRIAGGSAGYDNIDALVVDPTDSSIVYASDSNLGGVVRINGANGSNPTVTKIVNISSPGPIAINAADHLFVHDRSGAKLWYSGSPKSAPAATSAGTAPGFTNGADSFYAENTSKIRGLGVSSDDYVYTASNSGGMEVGAISGTRHQAPTVSITSPIDGTPVTIGSTVNITASASADPALSVSRVQFYVDGQAQGNPDTASPYSYSWNTTGIPAGSHSITAQVVDSSGQSATSSPVTVTASNPSTLAITMATPPSPTTIGSTVNLSAAVSQATAPILRVEFYSGSSLLGTATSAPYTYSWNTTGQTAGVKSLSAKVYDSAGHTATSSSVSVTLQSPVQLSVSLSATPTTVDVGSPVTLSAVANSSAGVTKVEFYVGSTLIATKTQATGTPTWNPTQTWTPAIADVGVKSMTAKAYDAAGNSTTSAAANVTVNNLGGLVGDFAGGPGGNTPDGHVNGVDYGVMTSHLPPASYYAPADLNHDNSISAADIAILFGHWTW